jgi:hypothetical protein
MRFSKTKAQINSEAYDHCEYVVDYFKMLIYSLGFIKDIPFSNDIETLVNKYYHRSI